MFPKSLIASALTLSALAFSSTAHAGAFYYSFTLDDLASQSYAVTLDSGTLTSRADGPSGWPSGSVSSSLTGSAGSQYGQIYIDLNNCWVAMLLSIRSSLEKSLASAIKPGIA